MFVFVSAVKDLEITLTLLPTTDIERFLSSSFKNTGVVTPLPKSTKSPSLESSSGISLLLCGIVGLAVVPLKVKLATSALNNVNV